MSDGKSKQEKVIYVNIYVNIKHRFQEESLTIKDKEGIS